MPHGEGIILVTADHPAPEEVLRDAQNRVSRYRVRIDDDELDAAARQFYAAAMLQAMGEQPGFVEPGGMMQVIDRKQASLNRANERIGVLLKSL
jgi:hypothetical protein